MSTATFVIFSMFMLGLVLTCILFVVFGDVAVRRLRKITEIKDKLGFEYVNGRDIMNVAMALSIPRKLNQRDINSKAGFMFADAGSISPYTRKVDRFIAKLFFWSYLITVFTFIVFVILDTLKIILKAVLSQTLQNTWQFRVNRQE